MVHCLEALTLEEEVIEPGTWIVAWGTWIVYPAGRSYMDRWPARVDVLERFRSGICCFYFYLGHGDSPHGNWV